MAALTITQRVPTIQAPPTKRPRLRTEKGIEFEFPWAPRGVGLSGLASPVTVQARPGRKPLTLLDGEGLAGIDLAFQLAHRDHQQPIEGAISQLRKIAESGQRVTVLGLSPQERGPWRVDDLTITGTLRRQGTNDLTRADVTLSLVEASDANPKVGPVSGGHGGKGGKRPKFYVIRKGDTLRKIANRFYGDPGVWRQIAKANGIKHPNKPKVGRKIKLPKIAKGKK